MKALILPHKTLKENFFWYAEQCLKTPYILDHENKKTVLEIIDQIQTSDVGILLLGNPGSGKTFIMEVLSRIIHPKESYHFGKRHTHDIVTDFNANGHIIFTNIDQRNMMYDDLGAEDKGKHYSEYLEVMAKLIQMREKLFSYNGYKSHFTSNNTFNTSDPSKDEIKARYELRAHSRLNSMCDVFKLANLPNSTDRRKLKNLKGFLPVYHAPVKTKEDLEWEAYYSEIRKNAQLKAKSQPEFKGSGSRLRDQMNSTFNVNPEILKKIVDDLMPASDDAESFEEDVITQAEADRLKSEWTPIEVNVNVTPESI